MGDRRRILVVDDDPSNLNLVHHILESLGYEAELVDNGSDALDKLRSDIQMVLLDAMMPGMNGFKVAERIRHDPAFRNVPIIMVTVLSGTEDRRRAFDAGVNDFVSKPIDRLELKTRMESLFKVREIQAETEG